MTASDFEGRREQVIERLAALVRDDGRLIALWLQGSLASGSADPLSDIDAYIAVRDDAFDAVFEGRLALVERLDTVLAWSDATVPGLRAVHALLDGLVRLDLIFEPASGVAALGRPAARLLVDKDGIGGRLRVAWEPPVALTARVIEATLRMTRQGAGWPLRLLHRGQWSTLAMMELDLINGQLAQLMAVQADPGLHYHNQFSVYRALRPEQQAEIDALTDAALAALRGRSLTALRDLHLRVFDALVVEGRGACAALGLTYPIAESSDAYIRALLVREWPQTDADLPPAVNASE